jgi:hypothetical protein
LRLSLEGIDQLEIVCELFAVPVRITHPFGDPPAIDDRELGEFLAEPLLELLLVSPSCQLAGVGTPAGKHVDPFRFALGLWICRFDSAARAVSCEASRWTRSAAMGPTRHFS